MRSRVFVLLILAGTALTVPRNLGAQNYWWGAMGGVNRSEPRDVPGVEAGWGGIAGVYAAKRFGPLEIQPNFMAVWRRASQADSVDFAVNHIDIHVLFGIPFGDRVQPMLYVAPGAMLCASSEQGCGTGSTVGISASAGASVIMGPVIVDIRYTRGLAGLEEAAGKWDSLMLMAGFRLAMGAGQGG